jgi:hypothetical protein
MLHLAVLAVALLAVVVRILQTQHQAMAEMEFQVVVGVLTPHLLEPQLVAMAVQV